MGADWLAYAIPTGIDAFERVAARRRQEALQERQMGAEAELRQSQLQTMAMERQRAIQDMERSRVQMQQEQDQYQHGKEPVPQPGFGPELGDGVQGPQPPMIQRRDLPGAQGQYNLDREMQANQSYNEAQLDLRRQEVGNAQSNRASDVSLDRERMDLMKEDRLRAIRAEIAGLYDQANPRQNIDLMDLEKLSKSGMNTFDPAAEYRNLSSQAESDYITRTPQALTQTATKARAVYGADADPIIQQLISEHMYGPSEYGSNAGGYYEDPTLGPILQKNPEWQQWNEARKSALGTAPGTGTPVMGTGYTISDPLGASVAPTGASPGTVPVTRFSDPATQKLANEMEQRKNRHQVLRGGQ